MTRKSNSGRRQRVYKSVKYFPFPGSLLVLVMASGFTYDFYASARQKVDLIASGRLHAGARVDLSLRELNAYADKEVPVGVRSPKQIGRAHV